MARVHVDHYFKEETGPRKEIRDQCVRQLAAIRGLNIAGGENLVCPDATDYLFLLSSVEEKSDEYDLYYKTSIIGGAFIHRDGVEIIMHPGHRDKEHQLLDELDRVMIVDPADRHVEVRTEMK
jgi:hypothetical protein